MDIGKYGVWFFLDGMTAPQSAEFARTVEKLGYGALWIPEAVGREPFAHAAYPRGTDRKAGLRHRHRQHLCARPD